MVQNYRLDFCSYFSSRLLKRLYLKNKSKRQIAVTKKQSKNGYSFKDTYAI